MGSSERAAGSGVTAAAASIAAAARAAEPGAAPCGMLWVVPGSSPSGLRCCDTCLRIVAFGLRSAPVATRDCCALRADGPGGLPPIHSAAPVLRPLVLMCSRIVAPPANMARLAGRVLRFSLTQRSVLEGCRTYGRVRVRQRSLNAWAPVSCQGTWRSRGDNFNCPVSPAVSVAGPILPPKEARFDRSPAAPARLASGDGRRQPAARIDVRVRRRLGG
eukprot:COSAG06_NODE_6637_length_2845_cov_1.736708_2_plen_218_part_00